MVIRDIKKNDEENKKGSRTIYHFHVHHLGVVIALRNDMLQLSHLFMHFLM